MTPNEARTLIQRTLVEVAPDTDISKLSDDADYRQHLELDSLDFLLFVEKLSAGTGIRIEEYDYRELLSVKSASEFLVAHSADTAQTEHPASS